MKQFKIAILVAITAATMSAFTACTPEVSIDKQLVALEGYIDLQTTPGIYAYQNGAGTPIYTFDRNDGQGYFNKSKLTYRIMNTEANKYVQFVLSAEPVVDQTVDVKVTSSGVKGVSSNVTYKAMKVERIDNNLCYLVGGADTKYTALIVAWID